MAGHGQVIAPDRSPGLIRFGRAPLRGHPGGTRIIDDWRRAGPFGVVGRIVDRLVLGPLLGRLLASRDAALAREAVGDKPRTAKSV